MKRRRVRRRRHRGLAKKRTLPRCPTLPTNKKTSQVPLVVHPSHTQLIFLQRRHYCRFKATRNSVLAPVVGFVGKCNGFAYKMRCGQVSAPTRRRRKAFLAPAAQTNRRFQATPRHKEALSEVCEHVSISAQQVNVVKSEVTGVYGTINVLLGSLCGVELLAIKLMFSDPRLEHKGPCLGPRRHVAERVGPRCIPSVSSSSVGCDILARVISDKCKQDARNVLRCSWDYWTKTPEHTAACLNDSFLC